MPVPSHNWVRESKLNFLERLAINVLKVGHVPSHVAFIMDGNRRFANKNSIDKKTGHSKGFEKLSETLQWCLDIGISEVTVYAFSIENFNRSEDEVEALMSLAREKFENLLEERDKLHEKGIRIRVIGNLSLMPKDLLKSMAEAMLMTKDNHAATLNVAFAYTSRDEIANAFSLIAGGVKEGQIEVDDIDEQLISDCLYTNQSKPLDLLVRTSGELRFSDFLLWQSTGSVVHFTKTLWPEFSIWHLLTAVFYYQQCYSKMLVTRYVLGKGVRSTSRNEACKKFLENVNNQRLNALVAASQ